MKLKYKLIVTYLLIALVPLLLVALLGYANIKESLLTLQRRSLGVTADYVVDTVDNFFNFFRLEIDIVNDSFVITNYLPIIFNLKESPIKPEYIQARGKINEQMMNLVKDTGIENVMFVNQNGEIVYATDQKFEKQLIDKLFPVFGAEAFEKGQTGVFLTDLNLYLNLHAKDNDNVIFLVSAPVNDANNSFVGVIIFEVRAQKLFTLVQHASGLGETGETLIVRRILGGVQNDTQVYPYNEQGEHVLYLNPLRFNPQAAFKLIVPIGSTLAKPAQRAVQGENGSSDVGINDIDYRGKEVIATWRYLPQYHWGLVVKIDTSELLLPAQQVIFAILAFGLVAGLSIIVIAWLLARTVSLPLVELTNIAEKIGQGSLEVKFSKKLFSNNDEVGILSKTLVASITKLKDLYQNLEKKVKEKTVEIEEKNEKLEKQQQEVLNTLESVEVEKNKAEILANDLEKFKLAVDNASDHIMITDPEGGVIYGNKMVEKITGYTLKESIGKKAGILWHLPMPKEFYEEFWDTIKNKKQTFIGVLQNRRKSGEIYDAAVSISPVLDKNKNILYYVGIERDVTKEKQIDRAKTEFVSLASHQLRTPLSTINWYTEMLLNGDAGKLKKEQTEYLEQIYKGNQRMVELVNALLNVSRLELGTFMVEPVECDLRKIADEVVEEFAPKFKEKKIDVKKTFAEIPTLNLDKKLTRIIIENLISNAVKYTPEKGKINLFIKKEKKNVEIIVSDTGMGIPLAQQEQIFSKFFRADNVRASDTEGTGLGLYMVKSIVEQSGGKISFESIKNKGTTFYVTLPLAGMKKKEGDKELS